MASNINVADNGDKLELNSGHNLSASLVSSVNTSPSAQHRYGSCGYSNSDINSNWSIATSTASLITRSPERGNNNNDEEDIRAARRGSWGGAIKQYLTEALKLKASPGMGARASRRSPDSLCDNPFQSGHHEKSAILKKVDTVAVVDEPNVPSNIHVKQVRSRGDYGSLVDTHALSLLSYSRFNPAEGRGHDNGEVETSFFEPNPGKETYILSNDVESLPDEEECYYESDSSDGMLVWEEFSQGSEYFPLSSDSDNCTLDLHYDDDDDVSTTSRYASQQAFCSSRKKPHFLKRLFGFIFSPSPASTNPRPSPGNTPQHSQNASTQEMHSRLELYATR